MSGTCEPSTEERPLSDFPLWEKALRHSGHLAYAVSSESGLHVGVINARGGSVQTEQQAGGYVINIFNLEVLEPLVREDGHGDGSSHGATWAHMLDHLQGLRDVPRGHSPEHAIDLCVNIGAEGMNRHHGCWSYLYEQVHWLMSNPAMYELRVGGLIDLVTVQLELNYRFHLKTYEERGLPLVDRTWEQPKWLRDWLDKYYDELHAEELARA